MKVVIVAKTRRGGGACVGGLTFEGRSVRLESFDREWNDQAGLEYSVGEVWDVEYTEPEQVIPPHVENIVVYRRRRLGKMSSLSAFIHRHMPPKQGGVDVLYEGRTGATSTGALYVAERFGIPSYSTMFWIPDQPLQRVEDAKRIRYRYPTPDGGRTLTFVGFQDPVEVIPAGTLLRVSLAHWWRPPELAEGELRCYMQLSGWISPLPAQRETTTHAAPSRSQPRPSAPRPESIEAILRQVFGYDTLRPLQADIIQNVLKKQDTLVVMPTGSGKSLCYQLPALRFDGLTVVVSPLISLMEDQVSQLREMGVAAAFLNSTLDYQEYQQTMALVRQGQIKLLYAAPETLLRPETLVLLDQSRVECLAIDEAHCISTWGHDFRPEYRQLRSVRQRLPDAVCIALTATATPRVRADIQQTLGLSQTNSFIASFDRDNLFLMAEPRTNGLQQVLDFLSAHRDESGIIYCATRRRVDMLTEQLRACGWSALPYHAGLDDATRRRHQQQFTRDDAPIMVATVAFGMGIDKSNVRFILHHDLPKDLESYYQQIGRAGRDGLRADCLLLYSYSDVHTITHFIEQMARSEQRGATMRLQAMLRYAEATVCRRRLLLDYFGESFEANTCDMCDICLAGERSLVDVTIPAQKFLSCVKRTGERFGVNYVVDVLRGSRSQRILQRGHDELSTYGIGREFSKKHWQNLARQFIQQGLVKQDMEHGSLTLTAKAYAVFKGEVVWAEIDEGQKGPAGRRSADFDYDADLFALLRTKRKELADAAHVPPYVIFSDRSLAEMACYFPQSRASFARISGVGQVKLEKYADLFLPIIRSYCRERDIPEQEKPEATRTAPRVGDRTATVAALYNSGKSIPDIAALLRVKRRTVISHLWKAAQAGQSLRPDGFRELSQLPPETQTRVLAVFAELGADYLRPVYDALEGAVDWDELHLLRLYHVAARE
jgi:ATP-dependent DNA helicase RecQ